MGRVTRVYQVWIDTRDERGEVVQYIERVVRTRKGAKARVNRINSYEDDYPNMVAWYEEFEAGDPENSHPWTMNSRARLNPSNVEEIRARHTNGDSVNFLADEFGVHRSTIYDVINGVSWIE